MQNETKTSIDVIVIGAGLTGLTTAHTLRKRGKKVLVIEKEQRIGGQIQTHRQGDFTFLLWRLITNSTASFQDCPWVIINIFLLYLYIFIIILSCPNSF